MSDKTLVERVAELRTKCVKWIRSDDLSVTDAGNIMHQCQMLLAEQGRRIAELEAQAAGAYGNGLKAAQQACAAQVGLPECPERAQYCVDAITALLVKS